MGSILDNYNPRIIKERWNRVKSSPYASLKFQYIVTKWLVIGLIIFICYTLFNLIINYDGGSNFMTMAMRGIMLIVMVVIVLKSWGTLAPLKKALQQYEKNPSSKKSTGIKIDVSKEIDEIFANIEKNKNRLDSAKKP
jgi:hypothetical protein